MAELTRRTFLAGSVAAIALPAPSPVAAVTAPHVPLAAYFGADPMPMWIAGTPGEMDWKPYAARTAEEAWLAYCDDNGLEDDECEFSPDLVAREPAWDGLDPRRIGNADWLQAGYCTFCQRCDCEITESSDGRVVGDEAVCLACMTPDERAEP